MKLMAGVDAEFGSFSIRSVSSRIGTVRGSFGFFNRIAMLVDGVATAGATAILQVSRGSGAGLAAGHLLSSMLVASVVVVLALNAISAYRIEHYRHLRRSLLDLLCGTIAALAAMAMIDGLVPVRAGAIVADFGPAVGVTLGSLAVGRVLLRALYHRLHRRNYFQRKVAIIGDDRALARQILDNASSEDFEVVGLFAHGQQPVTDGEAQLRSIAELRRIAHHRHVDLIVLAIPWASAERMFEIAAKVQWISADIVVPLDTTSFMPDEVVRVAGRDMLLLASHPLRGSQGVVKLVEDYAIGALALAIAAPVMLIVALLIRLEGRGPVFFRQLRMGINGQPFYIRKFRTMAVCPDDDGSVAVTRDDPRLTRVGAFLRRTSLDELPQLLNVLAGEMSIVGPRPHVPGMLIEGAVYSDLVQTYAARHRLKPGITGWAQINGMRAGITSAAIARRGVELDLFYIRKWSLKLDLDILVRTVTANMIGRQIY